jgi:hypothetical protein
MKKNLSKILREHNQAKKTLETPVPEGMSNRYIVTRYGDPREYLIGSPLKLIAGNGTFAKKRLHRKLESLKISNKRNKGLTPEQIYENLMKRYPMRLDENKK